MDIISIRPSRKPSACTWFGTRFCWRYEDTPRDLHGSELTECLVRSWMPGSLWDVWFAPGTTKYPIKRAATLSCGPRTPQAQTISVPAHKPLRLGTLNAILKQISAHKGVTRQAILDSLS